MIFFEKTLVRPARTLLGSLICALAVITSAPWALACRQALVLGLDVSYSVDGSDFELQRQGLAQALVDQQVMDAMIGAAGNELELAIFEWSGRSYQRLLSDWTVIDSPETLKRISASLVGTTRTNRSGRTAIGSAMLFARNLLAERENCMARTLDLSGDGKNNGGMPPEMVKSEMDAAGVVVNGLVIGLGASKVFFGENNITELRDYFEKEVIVGPSSFVETVIGFENYAGAIKRKLLREVMPALVERQMQRRATPL